MLIMASKNSIWGAFKSETRVLFEKGYKLPGALQVSAIQHIESHLDTWKEKVAHKRGSKCFSEFIPEDGDSSSKAVLPNELINSPADNTEKESSIGGKACNSISNTSDSARNSPIGKRLRLRKSCIENIPSDNDKKENVESSGVANDVTDQSVSSKVRTRGSHRKSRSTAQNTDSLENEDTQPEITSRRQCVTSQKTVTTGHSIAMGRRRRQVVNYAQLVNKRFKNRDHPKKKTTSCTTPKEASSIKDEPLPKVNDDGVLEIKPIETPDPVERGNVVDNGIVSAKEEKDDLESVNLPEKRYSCPLCDAVHKSKPGHALHMKKHKAQSHPCADCSFVGYSDTQLDKHIIKMHLGQEESVKAMRMWNKMRQKAKTHTCELCGKVFASDYNLKFHMEVHEKGPLKCSDCPKTFQSKIGYATHVKIHTREGLNHCDLCDYVTGSKATLKHHVKHVHYREMSHLCDTCGRKFGTKTSLKRHLIIAHTENDSKEWVYCSHCDFKTVTPANLRNHVKNRHNEAEKHMCGICGVTVKYKESLTLHMKRHSSDKSSRCPDCTFRAVCDKDLKAHIKRKHMDTRYVCDICEKSFNDRGHLQRHRVIHTGEKKFSCQFCRYRCNVRSNLSKHLLVVHKHKEILRSPIVKIDAKNESEGMIEVVELPVLEGTTDLSEQDGIEVVFEVEQRVKQGESPVENPAVDLVEQAVFEAVGDVKSESEGLFCLEVDNMEPTVVDDQTSVIVQNSQPMQIMDDSSSRGQGQSILRQFPQQNIVVQHVAAYPGHVTENTLTIPETGKNYDDSDQVAIPDSTQVDSSIEPVSSHEIVEETIHIDHETTVDDMGNAVKEAYVSSEEALQLFTDDGSVVFMTIDS